MMAFMTRDPTGIRTPDRLLRRQLLYPAELSDQSKSAAKIAKFIEITKLFSEKVAR